MTKSMSVHYILLEFRHKHVPFRICFCCYFNFKQCIPSPDVEIIQLMKDLVKRVFCLLLNGFCQTAILRPTRSLNRTENGL
jgi:hypothetical protein